MNDNNPILTVTGRELANTSDLYGIFFEDINHAADGGLYAEMIRNRAFEFSPVDCGGYKPLTSWKKVEEGGAVVSASVSDKAPYSLKNPHYLVLSVEKTGTRAGIKNVGFNTGLPLRKGEKYVFSCYAKADEACEFQVSLEDAYGKSYCAGSLSIAQRDWQKYSFVLTPDSDDFAAVLAITTTKTCKACFDFVSLFPVNTYKNRENGLRKDIAEMLADLKPGFMRFPGGCLVHDGSLNANDRNANYRWKNTIGDITERASRRNNWNYNQTLGLGYYEYFLFCEDIGAKPLPVLPAGYNPHMEMAAPLDEMQEWIDDALDLIEFANGAPDSKWGSVRAKMGHAEPFGLEYLAIGNEEVGQGFWDRYDIIHKAIREKYPEIKLINSAGPFPGGGEWERGWNNARKNGSDLVDEHYYTSPEWMLANMHRYDDLPEGPKVFLGEYATWGNTFYNAVTEAAYMTSLENNAARVGLACYAPLLCNVDYRNWSPDLIWFDNHRVYGSVNYYVQKMFMNNRGKYLLESKLDGLGEPIVFGGSNIEGEIKLFAENCKAEFRDIKVTDIVTGEVKCFENAALEFGKGISLGSMNSAHYKVEFDAVRKFGDKGFRLEFGKRDDGNFNCWNIGGWDNQDTEISGRINFRGTSLDQNIFSVATEVEYKLVLEVEGRRISSYINGKLANSAIDRNPVKELLYVSVTGDEEFVYIKGVNLRDTDCNCIINIEGIDEGTLFASVLKGEPGDENSFENPTKCIPAEMDPQSYKKGMSYRFEANSVTVLKIKK